MIYIGDGNQSNVLDLGLVAAFNDGTYQHSGLVKDASDSGRWKLFSGVTAEPGTTVDFSTYTRDDLQVGGLYATSAVIGEVVNAEIQTLDGINTTKTIQAQLNERLTSATAATTYATIADNELKAPKNSPTFTGTVTLPAGTVTSEMIADGAVATADVADVAISTAKIADGAVTLGKLADGAISSAKLADGSVTSSKIGTSEVISGKIANGAVTSTKIAALAVQTSHIEDGAVTSAKIADGTITSADLADDAVTSAKITDGSVTTSELADGAVTSAKILNGSIADIDINAAAAIAPTKIAGEALTKANTGDITNAMLAGFIDQSKIIDLVSNLAAKAPSAAPTFTGTVVLPNTTSIGNVSATEIGYVDGVTSAIQTQLDSKLATGTAASTYAPIASATLTGTPSAPTATAGTSTTQLATTAFAKTEVTNAVAALTKSSVGLANVDNTADTAKPVSTAQATAIATAKSEAIADATSRVTAVINGAPAAFDTLKEIADYISADQSAGSALTSSVALKAPIASPTFTGTVTVAAAGVAFTDGTQTKAGVPSITTIATEKSASETLAAGEQDKFIPLSGTVVITLPATGYSTGQSIDFWQSTGTGASFASTNGVIGTPGLKLRATNSVATAMKISSGWLVFGDLSA